MAGFLLGWFFALVAGYMCGSISFAFLVGKFNGIDIRRYGSGNVGATNVRRVLGRGWGRFCFVMDVLKGLLPVLLMLRLTDGAAQPAAHAWFPVIAAAGAVCGHVWPFWLGFKGGKGVATTIGALLALVPWCVAAALVAWLLVFRLTRTVSMASLAAAALLPLSGFVLDLLRLVEVSGPTLALLVALAVLIVIRHRSNIRRLLDGTEPRFEKK
ncbi:MAG: glycerol-3-phosphate 1-O-acyltransferase PlsY [Kiritimatiellaeota bacterium]|nr:glycerol-3-phosphate 1-O-acyltransferase PlsY [Kiritimatiellota bacterium]